MSSSSNLRSPSTRTAVIYCRVATWSQMDPGSDLLIQEVLCRVHAAAKGYVVNAVFAEHASGTSDVSERPSLKALMNYLGSHPGMSVVVIAVDPARFFRDVHRGIRLRDEIEMRSATIEYADQPSYVLDRGMWAILSARR